MTYYSWLDGLVAATLGVRKRARGRDATWRHMLRVLLAFALIIGALQQPAVAQAPTYVDEFDGSALSEGWTTEDGYAIDFPSDTSNHAQFSVSGSKLSIFVPLGADHNMWWLRHAQVTRAYSGSGVYEAKMDSALDGEQQFGLIFESSPGTFIIFLMIAHDGVWGYVERFVSHDGGLHRHTLPGMGTSGHNTGLPFPHPGPYWVRVIVDDNGVPQTRTWKFQWSINGANWTTAWDGVVEGALPWENIGHVAQVGMFAGNHLTLFSQFDARFDYFRSYPLLALPLEPPAGLSAMPGDGQVGLTWSAVTGANRYTLYRRTGVGPYATVFDGPGTGYLDTAVSNGVTYRYMVTARDATRESANSNEVQATPAGLPLAAPAAISVLSGDARVTLEWGSVAEATGYRIYRRVGGESFELLHEGTSTNHVDTSVVNGTSYGYVVTAFDAARESVYSSEVIGIPEAPLPIPAALPTAGLALLLDASNVALPTGSAVTRWRDASGTAHDASAAGAMAPTLVTNAMGSAPALRFDGIGDGMSVAPGFADFTAGLTMFVVARPTEPRNWSKLVLLGNGLGPGAMSLSRSGLGSGLAYASSDAAGTFNWFETGSALVAGEVAVYALTHGAGPANTVVQATISRNGTVVGSGPAWVPPVTTRSQNLIGASNWPGDGTFAGDIAEIIVYQRALSPAEQAAVTAHLVSKYGVSPPVPPLPAPATLSAVAGDGQVALSWGSVANATGYRIYRRTGSGAYSLLQQVAATGYVDATAINGATYGYVVTAIDATRESPVSSEVLATPEAALPIPAALPATGLLLLLDAGNVALPDGSVVARWRDASSGQRDATASVSAEPIVVAGAVNGRPVLRFDGQGDGMVMGPGFADFTAGLTMFLVARPTAATLWSKLMVLGNGIGPGAIALSRNLADSSLLYTTADSQGSFAWFVTGNALVPAEAAVYSVVQGGGTPDSQVTATVSRNGVAIGSGAVWVPPVVTRSQNLIGHSNWPGDGTFAGDIAEVIVYNRELSAAELVQVTGYLVAKYGLSSPVDLTLPSVTATVPSNGASNVVRTANLTATFSEPMNAASITASSFVLRDASGVLVPASVTYNATTRVATLNPSPTLVASAVHTATVVGGATGVKDQAGNAMAADKTWSFTTQADATAPTVTATVPVDGSVGFVRTANPTATFSEEMDAATINTSTVVLRDASSSVVPATVSYSASARRATLNPTPTLASASVYTLTIVGGGAGVKDTTGNPMATDRVVTFTTETDATAPTVTATSPASGTSDVSRTANVTATFSEEMDPASIDATSFELRDPSGTVVPAVVTYSASARRATLNPTPTLDYLTTYTAVLRSEPGGPQIRDVTGNPLAATVAFTFTTVADTTPPTVSSISPASGATNVSRTANITATFNEAMDEASIGPTTVLLTGPSGQAVAATITYASSNRRVTIDPVATLAPLATYTVTVRGGTASPSVRDAQGVAMAVDRVWSFVTRP